MSFRSRSYRLFSGCSCSDKSLHNHGRFGALHVAANCSEKEEKEHTSHVRPLKLATPAGRYLAPSRTSVPSRLAALCKAVRPCRSFGSQILVFGQSNNVEAKKDQVFLLNWLIHPLKPKQTAFNFNVFQTERVCLKVAVFAMPGNWLSFCENLD